MSDLELHNPIWKHKIECPKCAAGKSHGRVEASTSGDRFELRCLSCHETIFTTTIGAGDDGSWHNPNY